MAGGALPSLKSLVATKRQPGKDNAAAGALPSLKDVAPGLSGGGLPTLKELVSQKPGAAAKPHHSGGLLHTLGHAVTQTGSDLKDAALHTPGGLYAMGHAVESDILTGLKHGQLDPITSVVLHGKNTRAIAKGQLELIKQDVQHPLRHPGNTLLDALAVASLGAGSVARVGEVGRVARAGEGAGAIAKAALEGPKPPPRVLNVGGLEVRGHYSRSAGSRVMQRVGDKALAKGAEKGVGVTVGRHELSVERLQQGRAAKWLGREQRVADSVARAPGTRLQVLGQKLKPDELRALRLVAEETPVERRLGAQEMRKGRATNPKEQARHQERIDLTRAAMEHLTSDAQGRPVFKPEATKLRKVYGALKAASTDRESLLEQVGLLDQEGAQAAKTKTARLAAGAVHVDTAVKEFRKQLGNPGAVAEYTRRFGNVIDADNVREFSRHYAKSNEAKASLAAPLHADASAFAKKVYAEKLAEAPKSGLVDFTSGGAGAGKSTFSPPTAADVVYDTTLSNSRTAVQKIEQALSSGRHVNVNYVYRDPVEALKGGVIPRALADGRTLPLDAFVQSHVGANRTIRTLARRYKNDPRVTIRAVHNKPGGAAEADLAQLPKLNYDEVANAVKDTYARELSAGKLPAHLAAGFEQPAARGARGRGHAAGAGAAERSRPQGPAQGLVGAEDIVASPEAVHIGNPVERTKLAGKPRVSSTGSFGHTRKPGSMKVATGGALEHALERNDVTQIVAERHSEAVRLSKIDRVRTKLAKAGNAVPQRRDDVFVWTDNLTKNERIPAEVRKYLDNPESVAQLPEADRVSLTEKLRQSVFERHDWHADPEARQQFEKIAQQGKGTFVPRKLVGEYAKREITLPGSHFIDAVNNAQKAGLIYLKVNYPVVQGVSNVAMNLIHQGFAAPVRLTQAVKLDRAIGPELAHVVDDIMGQGAVVQAQFEGQGLIARGSQKLAHAMSSKVDTPSRRAAFLHEADKAGYDTGPKLEQLLTDESKIGDLGEVAQRAKEAIVDYGDLGPNERAIIRRLVFVYPWQKGATKYAAHFLRDHPIQGAALGHVGEQQKQRADEQLGPVPSYLQGVFDAGGGLVNPAGVNFFQTPAQIGQGVAGLASGNPASPSGQDFLAPLPGILVAALTRKDSIGRPLSKNPAAALRDLTIGQTPAAALLRAAVGDHDVARKMLGSQTSSKTFPDPNDAYWRFLLGGLYPREYSKPALHRNAAREKAGR